MTANTTPPDDLAPQQAMGDSYADIAEWYDVEHDRFAADVEFYQAVILSPDGARINALEIGGGTGRLAAALGLGGWTVTAIEPSAAMCARFAARLARLPRTVARRISIVAGSATAPNLPAPSVTGDFDAAIIALGTFAHLTDAEERSKALAGVRPRLHSTGKLVIDLDLEGPRYLAEHPGERLRLGAWTITHAVGPRHAQQQLPRRRLAHFATGAPGPATGTVSIHHEYIVTEDRREISRTTTSATLALLTYTQVADEIRQAGFQVSAVYGDYDLAAFVNDSPRALIVATIAG